MINSPNLKGPGLFEPIHGSAPDIAGQVRSTKPSHCCMFSALLYVSSCGILVCFNFRIKQIH